MAFPSSPTDGDFYNGYYWDATIGAWVKPRSSIKPLVFSNYVDKLKQPTPDNNSRFGKGLATDGDYLIVGKTESPELCYVFRKIRNVWTYDTTLGTEGQYAALSGEYAIIWDTGAPLVVFHRTGVSTWDSGTTITSSGNTAAIDGDYIVTGDPFAGSSAGEAKVYHRTGVNTWDTGISLVDPDVGGIRNFGTKVSISGDYVLVGADEGQGSGTGAAYVYRRTGTNSWSTGVSLVPPSSEVQTKFGGMALIKGDYALIGDQSEEYAVVYHRTGTNTWDSGVVLDHPISTSGYLSYSEDINGRFLAVRNGDLVDIYYRTGINSWERQAQIGEGSSSFFEVSMNKDEVFIPDFADDETESNSGAVYVYKIIEYLGVSD